MIILEGGRQVREGLSEHVKHQEDHQMWLKELKVVVSWRLGKKGGLRGYKFIINFYYYKEIIFLSICIHKLKINILGSNKSTGSLLSLTS